MHCNLKFFSHHIELRLTSNKGKCPPWPVMDVGGLHVFWSLNPTLDVNVAHLFSGKEGIVLQNHIFSVPDYYSKLITTGKHKYWKVPDTEMCCSQYYIGLYYKYASYIYEQYGNLLIVHPFYFIYFIQAISIAPLQVHHYSKHGYCVGVSRRSATRSAILHPFWIFEANKRTLCNGPQWRSRHSARGPHHVADPEIQLGVQFNMFPSISRLFLHGRGAKVYSETGHGRICPPLDPPLIVLCKLSVLVLGWVGSKQWDYPGTKNGNESPCFPRDTRTFPSITTNGWTNLKPGDKL